MCCLIVYISNSANKVILDVFRWCVGNIIKGINIGYASFISIVAFCSFINEAVDEGVDEAVDEAVDEGLS